MQLKDIVIKGAREHNLKNIDVTIPRNSLTVITGLSGSGKSSLAFDTLYSEGQRRYVESLSAYARQFLGLMEKPDVDSIEGLSPAISIEQKTTGHNPRSTVGTITEIHDYLALAFCENRRPDVLQMRQAHLAPDRAGDHRQGAGASRGREIPDPLARSSPAARANTGTCSKNCRKTGSCACGSTPSSTRSTKRFLLTKTKNIPSRSLSTGW